MNKLFFILIIIFFSSFQYGQDKYLIYFKDKGINPGAILNKSSELYKKALDNLSERAIQRRKKNMGNEIINYEDIPIKEDYLEMLRTKGIEIVHKLTWFNAISVYADEKQLSEIMSLSFVKKIELVKKIKYKKKLIPEGNLKKETQYGSSSVLDLDYGDSFGQLQLCDIPIVHSKGITGEGVLIGLLDTGYDWQTHESLMNSHVIAEYDFINNDSITANQPGDPSSQHNHGTSVMSVVGGFKNGTLIGSSFGSSFLLAKTEDLRWESHIEEDDYAAALIWMESMGVDVTSSSLGYSEFDDTTFSYTYADMNGQTTIVTRACELAFDRGVITITSAGNEGGSSWFYITAPADGFNTIAVGAVTSSNIVTGFSSRGPTYDGRIKPDIVTQGSSVFAAVASSVNNYSPGFGGTSAAAPIACGVAGLLLSAHPHLTNVQVRSILFLTAGNSTNPNNERGYGLASAQNAINYPNLQSFNETYIMHKIFINDIAINQTSVKLFYSVEQGSFREVDMNFDGNFRYNFEFPDLFNNQFIEFYFTYNDSSGGSYREPVNTNYGQLATDSDLVTFIPSDFTLSQNYPNPFNNQTKIEFTIPSLESAELTVFNSLGQKIKRLFSGVPHSRKNIIYWNGRDDSETSVSSGVYYYTLKSDGKILSRKMVLLK